ncbi:MAG: hypothetical protein AB7Q00_01145 [Phycisphaerales bacterium]
MTTTPTKPDAAPFDWAVFVRLSASMVAVVLFLGLVAVLVLGSNRLHARAVALVSRTPLTVEFVWPAASTSDKSKTWMPAETQRQMMAKAAEIAHASPDPLSPVSLDAIRSWLEIEGWFEGSPTVERSAGNALRITGTWRTPMALVKQGERECWLSATGHLMPALYPPGGPHPRTLENPSSPPPIDFATPWTGNDIDAGIDLLALLSRQPWFTQVAGVDLADFASQGTLTIVTSFDTRIVWGGPVDAPKFGDAPTRDKLRNLASLFQDLGRIDGGYPLVYANSNYILYDRSASAELARTQTPGPVNQAQPRSTRAQ